MSSGYVGETISRWSELMAIEGETDRILSMMESKLRNSEWSQLMARECRKVVQEMAEMDRERDELPSLDVIVEKMIDLAREKFPADVKALLLRRISSYLREHTTVSHEDTDVSR
mmetsp:Transcript_582/g.1159  ORF Transcript_582/g.1159 Transcript_582/m.1159 type:complete len:114 (-) Transcript_582:1248-1589(-)